MRIVSGMRPTGKLHIGHYFGAIDNWLRFQKEHECFFLVADWHALTSDYQDTSDIPSHTQEMVIDWLACGVDPEKAIVFQQSQVKEHAELYLLLSMFTPLGWLERNPTFKEQKQQITDKDISNLGFFGYPVLQATDVMIYKGQGVPVGKDQVPHLEITREIARRFNNLTKTEIFPEPEAILTETPKIMGTDGRKMSKSYHNSISLSDDENSVEKKIKSMVTDSNRLRRDDPGNPDACNLFPLHKKYSPMDTQQEVRQGCTTASMGCVDCKKILLPNINNWLNPIREKRLDLENKPNRVREILHTGNQKARQVATSTIEEVRKTLHLAS
ncbi:MAG: tryptophan--tRNA ligase [Deltaproteobacteria bacterium]|nr:tryptophan--tRNA ligase [Deltaproteobacteria bacterium]